METLDPKVAKEIEEKAVNQFGNKSASLDIDPYQIKVIAKFKSAFPFEIFRDELILTERRIIWIQKYGPLMSRVISVLPQDIADIEASTGPLIGHLHIRNFTGGEEIVMEHLWRKDLQKARDIVESLMLRKRVGFNSKSKNSLQDKIEKMLHVDF